MKFREKLRPDMGRVMLVDDEPMVLESSKKLLQNLGFDVHAVAEAGEILPALRRERPPVVLQDVRMPGLDLAGLVRAIRNDPELAPTRIILCSASMEVEEVAKRVGADDWLEKPYSPREFLDKLTLKTSGP